MQVAAVYDIHGHLPALEAVLAEIGRLDPDIILFGGDLAAGPLPGETLERLMSLAVCGHTHVQFDRAVAGKRVVNPGSVGIPYEGRPGAYWARPSA
jgi:Icc-related predicted phosphoesterase